MEPGPCASSPSESCQARKGAALRRIPASAAGRLGSIVGSQIFPSRHIISSEQLEHQFRRLVGSVRPGTGRLRDAEEAFEHPGCGWILEPVRRQWRRRNVPSDKIFEDRTLRKARTVEIGESRSGVKDLGDGAVTEFANHEITCGNEIRMVRPPEDLGPHHIAPSARRMPQTRRHEGRVRGRLEARIIERSRLHATDTQQDHPVIMGNPKGRSNLGATHPAAPTHRRHNPRIVFGPAHRLGLDPQISRVEEDRQSIAMCIEAAVAVGSIDPVPGEVLQQNAGHFEPVGDDQAERSDIADDDPAFCPSSRGDHGVEFRASARGESIEGPNSLLDILENGSHWIIPTSHW